MKNTRIADPRISQHLVPIALSSAGFRILDHQGKQLQKPRIRKCELRPVLCLDCLCGVIRRLTNLREEVG